MTRPFPLHRWPGRGKGFARPARLLLGHALPALLLLALALAGCARPAPTIEIVMRHSHFLPGAFTVPRGLPVTIVLKNEDPIDHEWIVGDEDVHERHRTGTEPTHDTRPTEVSVPALSTRITTVTFAETGKLRFVCHLPGHEAYGMTAELRVVRR